MTQLGVRDVATPDRHLERVEHEIGAEMIRDLPADDHAGEHVEDERDVAPAFPCRGVGDVREPQLVGSLRTEVAAHQIRCPRRGRVRDRCEALLAPLHASQAHLGHEPLHGAASDHEALAAQLLVDPPRSVAVVVGVPHPLDLDLEALVADRSRRAGSTLRRVIRPFRELEGPTHHPHRPAVTVRVDEPDR
jgi:hypothetical protein